MQKVVGGLLANYEIVGPPTRKASEGTLVILPGWANDGTQWRQAAERLSKSYKVVLVDLPGFGGSQKPVDNWGVYDYVDWVKELLDKLGIKKYTVLGHSFGGRLGIILAAKYPSVVERLILVDAAGIEIKSWKAKVFAIFAPAFKWVPQKIKNWFGSPDYQTAGGMRKIFVRVVNEDLRHLFKAIQCPTLVVWGEKDMLLPIEQAKIICAGIKNSVLRIVWGATHWPHLEKWDDFMRILEEEGILITPPQSPS